MNVRRTRLTLWTTTAGLTGAGAAALLWSVLSPVHVAAPSTSQALSRTVGKQTGVEQVPELAQLQKVSRLNLRRPLVDPPPVVVAPPPPPPPPPPLTIRLAGTIIEPGQDRAILITPEGKIELRAIGESSGGAEVLQIRESSVTVRYHGKELTLEVEKKQRG